MSSEMVATVLPIYAVFALGASPLQYGVIDGLYQGAAGIVRVASGIVADRGAATRSSLRWATASRRSAGACWPSGAPLEGCPP